LAAYELRLNAMTSASVYDQKARIYALADPASIFQESEAIQRAVFEALQIAPSSQHRLTISESSAWFDYVAVGELWERKKPPALPAPADALKAAEGLLAKLEQRCSAANRAWPARLQGVALLPPVGLLRRAGLHAVARPDGSAWDHWLYRAEPQLLLDGGAKTKAGVFGAQVEVRIGHLGQVIGVRSRWRPLSGERKFTDLTPFRAPEAGGGGAGSSNEKPQAPILNFLLEGDGVPQHYLAPYYFQSSGDDVKTVSASPWSLTVDIGRTKQQTSRMTLTALAQGGSGDYLYNWAMYSLTDFNEGFREVGSGQTDIVESVEGRASASSLDFDNGHYVAMLNVKDRATGAFKHHQQQVFSSVFSSQSEEKGPLVA
jgi:hypothetical protein